MKRPKPNSIPTTVQKTIQTSQSTTTELLVQLFSDRIFIVISQRAGKLGTLLQCKHEHSVIDNSNTYHIETLLGKRDDALSEVYVRQIMERIVKLGGGINNDDSQCPPILLGIALKEATGGEQKAATAAESQKMFHFVIDEVLNLYQESIRVATSS